ncbi:MAG: hypothetical protein Q8K65_11660 [Alphaproteobacteria bacterium]|nr:hypothetical protein [Alphaproteobacteria bacterium]
MSLPENIARIQWNNRLKSGALCLLFIVAMAVFALTLFLMIAAPASFVPESGLSIPQMLAEPKMQLRILRFFTKVFFFAAAATLYFIYRDINNIDRLFSAQPLQLRSSDSFYRALENMCIARGLKTPALYIFSPVIFPPPHVSAAVVQGVGGKSALILTQGALNLEPPLQQALAAQVVQRLYTKDTYFLTLLCFLGHFPFHVSRATNVIGRIVFWLPLKAADFVLRPFRPLILNLRLQRLDAGALDLTKDAAPLAALAERLAPLPVVEHYIYTPYLSLFITKPA